LFDEDFFMYGEDAELSYRLTQQGWHIHCADQLLALHEGSGSSGSGTAFYEYHTARGHLLQSAKLQGARPTFARHLGRVLYLPTRAVLRSIRAGTFVPMTALYRAATDTLSANSMLNGCSPKH
jgi:GT2 family glycosyltransferase